MNRIWPFINPFGEVDVDIPILREAFDTWDRGGGIFAALEETFEDLPWAGSADSIVLDFEYFGNRSGGKFCSPAVIHLLGEGGVLFDDAKVMLATIIWTKFKQPWMRLWETNVISYNPIHNYNMTDQRELDRGESESRAVADSSVDTTTHGKTNEVTENVAGINNTDKKGKLANVSLSQEGGTTTSENNNERKDDAVKALNEHETINRSGNIGVTTTQQMLSSERELWVWNFFDQVYKDIDTVLSLPIYDPCRI